MPAGQSALLLGPEHFLRWGCHSMSSCDGVRPIVVEPVQFCPKGSPIPHAKAPANPIAQGTSPITGLVYAAICGTKKCLSTSLALVRGSRTSRWFSFGSGISVRSTRDVAASLLACCRGSRIFRPCRCGDFGCVSQHKPAEHRIPDVSATPDVEAPSITSCCGRRVSLSERRCGVTVCLLSRLSGRADATTAAASNSNCFGVAAS